VQHKLSELGSPTATQSVSAQQIGIKTPGSRVKLRSDKVEGVI